MSNTVQNAPAAKDLVFVENVPRRDWESFLRSQPAGCLFHQYDWSDPFLSYRLQLIPCGVYDAGSLVGVCPVVPIKSWLFGSQLVSLPWFDASGVRIQSECSSADAIVRALVAGVVEVAKAKRIPQVQLRTNTAQTVSPFVRHDKVLMRLNLEATAEQLWERLNAKVRNQVRKGQKSDLTIERGGADLLDAFHTVYVQNMRDLGSPAHHRKFFAEILTTFTDVTRIYIVRKDGHAIGCGWTMANGESLEIPWASSLRSYNRLCVNHLMYWQILADACADGFEQFHFGRSSQESGTYRFKKQWGAKEVQLHWYFLRTDGKDPEVKPVDDTFSWAPKMWQKLPVFAASAIGPHMIRQIP